MYKPTLGKSGASRSALPPSNGGSGFNSNTTKSQANLSTVHSIQDPLHSSQQGSLQPNYSVSTLGKIRSSVQSDMSTKNRLNTNSSSSNIDPSGSSKKQPLELNVKQTAKVEVKQSTSPSNLRHLKLNSSHNIFKASALSPFSKNTPNQQQKSTNNKTPSASIHAPGQALIPSANRIAANQGNNNNNNTRIATLDLTNEVKQTPITPFSTNIDQQKEAQKQYSNPQSSVASVAASKPTSNYFNLNTDSNSESELAKSALSNLKSKMNTQRNPSQNPVKDEYQNADQENQFDYSQNRRGKASVNDYNDNNFDHTPEEKSQSSTNYRDPFREGRQNNNQNSRSPFQQRDQMNYYDDDQVKSSKPSTHTFNQPKHSNNNSNTFNQQDDRDNNNNNSNNNYASSQYQLQQRARKPGSYSEPYHTKQIDEQQQQQQQYQQHPANHRQNYDDNYSQQYHPPLPNYPMYPRGGQQSHQPYPNYPPYDQNRYMNMPYPPQYYNDPPHHGNYHNDSNPNMYHNDHHSYSNYQPNSIGPGPRGYPSQQSYEWKGRNDLGRVMSYENFKRNSHNSYQQQGQQQRYPDEYPPSYYHQEQNYHRGGGGSIGMGMDYANNHQIQYNNNNNHMHSNYGGFFDPRSPTPVSQQNPNYRVNGYYDKYSNHPDQQGSLHNRTYDEYPRNGQDKQEHLNVKDSSQNPFARNPNNNNNNRQPTEPFPSERYSAPISDQNRLQTSDISEMNYTQSKYQRQYEERSQRDLPSQDYTRRDRSPAISNHVRGESNNANANDATSRTTTRNNFYPARGNNNNLSETSTGNATTTTNRDISRNRYDEQPDYYKYNESKSIRNTQRDSYTPENTSIAPQSRQQQPKSNSFQQTPLEDDSTQNSKASKKSFDIINQNITSNFTKGQGPARNTGSDNPRDFKNVDPYDNFEEYSEQNYKNDNNSSQQRSLSNNQSKQQQQQQPAAYQKNSRSNFGGSNDHSIHEEKPTNVNSRANTAMGSNSNGNRVPFDDMPIKGAPKKQDPFAYEQTKGSENQRSNFESNRNVRNDQGKGMHSSVPSGTSFDDVPIKGSKNTNLYSEAIDDFVQDDYMPQKQVAKPAKSPINSKANAQKKPQQNSTRDAYQRQTTDWEESEFEVNDEYHREDRPSYPRDFKAFQANYDSVDDDRPIKPSATGGNYDLKSLPKSAIVATSNKPVQQQKGRMGNAGQGNRNIGQIGNDENGGANIQLKECSQGCGRKFQLESLPKHEKICQNVFQKKRKVFDSQAKRTDIEELIQFNGGNQSSNKGGKKQGKQQQSKPSQDDKSKQKKPEEAGAKPRWLKQSEAFRAVIKMSKGGDDAPTSVPHSEAFSKEDYVQCHFCQRKFNETAAKRHIPFCEKKAKETSMKGPAPSKALGSNNQPMQSSQQQQQQQQRGQPLKYQSQQQPVQQQAIVSPQLKSQKLAQSKAPASGYTAYNQPPQSKRYY